MLSRLLGKLLKVKFPQADERGIPAPLENSDQTLLTTFLAAVDSIGHCCALQSKEESDVYSRLVECFNLPSHHDPQKNWDNLKSLYYLNCIADKNEPVLDAGSSSDSLILKWLALLGFNNLFACDIRAGSSTNYRGSKIKFSTQDLTCTDYPDEFFRAVACISVIEHGVDIDLFLEEMSRILAPSGFLLLSTDYWSEPVDCKGIFPYGPEMGQMRIFTPDDIEIIFRKADKNGLKLCSRLDLTTSERAVRWERTDRDYTFFFMALAKAP
jgi:SAM-dependent methyltransferase